jgi:hypothetical protein
VTVRGFTLNDGVAANSSSMTGTVPAAAAVGDVLVVLSSENTSTHTHSISGGGTGISWTLRSGPDDNSTNMRTYVWTATAVSDSPGATVTVTTSTGSGRLVGAGAAVSGEVETALVVQLTAQTTAGTSMPFPSVTVPDARGWTLLGLAVMRTGTTTAPTMATPPAGTSVDATSSTALSTQPEYSAVLLHKTATVTSGSQSPGTGTASASATNAQLYTLGLAPSASAVGSVTLGGSSTGTAPATSAGTVSLGGSASVSSVSVTPNPGVVTLAGGTSTAKAAATATGSVTLSGIVSTSLPAVYVDLFDYYLDVDGNLDRWMRGSTSTTQINAPGVPSNVQAVLSGTTATVTWGPPADNGGSPVTGYTVTREGGATHTLAASATSDTFTGLSAGGTYFFDVSATNVVGTGPTAVAKTASTTYRFPGDPLPLLTGKILWGATENDNDGTKLTASNEFCAPEADTGKKYSIIKMFYKGGSVEDCFIPSTGGIARDMKAHRPMGHIILANVAIQQSNSTHFSTWRAAANTADTVVYNTYYNFIQWCEEGADAPDCPVWVCMPHEAQQYPNKGKVSLVDSSGMTPGDYGDMQWAFRTCMDAYATAKAGSFAAYKWKRLSFGGIHTGEAFSIAPSNSQYAAKGVSNYYTSHANGGAPIAKRVHDWVGGDPYQSRIDQDATPGRTGVPMWNAVSQAMAAWCKSRGYPIVWGEFGIHQTDGDAADQLQAFFNEITNGTHDAVAACYWNSGSGGTIAAGNTRFLLTDHENNDPSAPVNGLNLRDSGGHVIGLKTCFENIMRSSNVVRFWDLGSPGIPGGYSKPPGV